MGLDERSSVRAEPPSILFMVSKFFGKITIVPLEIGRLKIEFLIFPNFFLRIDFFTSAYNNQYLIKT